MAAKECGRIFNTGIIMNSPPQNALKMTSNPVAQQ